MALFDTYSRSSKELDKKVKEKIEKKTQPKKNSKSNNLLTSIVTNSIGSLLSLDLLIISLPNLFSNLS